LKEKIEMDLLINKYLTNQASASERRDLELWISSSTQNKAYFEFQKRMWDSARMSRNEPKINVEDALAKFKQRHQIETKDLKLAGEVKRMRVKPLVFVRLAAACFVSINRNLFYL
jgi:ferric-dicitrate binding protein FerR (iron transport regulator)